jgi:hypothetical protein
MKDEEFIKEELATVDLRGVNEVFCVSEPQSRSGALRITCPKCKQPPGFPCFREAFKRYQAMGWGGRVVMQNPHKERLQAWKLDKLSGDDQGK